MFLVLELKVKL